MTTNPDAPADTTMMRIVHDALRRDLRRARAALTAVPPPARARQEAIAAHLAWMMQFLRAHHRSEDEGLYPVARLRSDQATEILDLMERQHAAIEPSIAAVEAAAAALAVGGSTTAIVTLADSVVALEADLLPHLRQEEDEAMPAVSAVLTNAEWDSIEEAHNLKPKSPVELAHEGHWLIDDATDEDRARVVGLVPAVPRYVLVHGFARRYRRRKEACWGAEDRRSRRVQKEGHVTTTADADIDAVWEVVRDVTRVGEWSHECRSVSWMGDTRSAAPGARFRGRNRAGLIRWGRVCEVVAVEPYELVWRTVPTALYPDSCEWRIELAEAGDGATTIEQSFRAVRCPKVLDLVYAQLIPSHRDRTAALAADLRRLGDLASQATTAARSEARPSTS